MRKTILFQNGGYVTKGAGTVKGVDDSCEFLSSVTDPFSAKIQW